MTPTSCTFFSLLDLRFPWNRILVNVVNVLFYFIIWPCLKKTGNKLIQEFDWLKLILTMV